CHVNAGPNRPEQMSSETVDLVVDVIDARRVPTIDITGGAPGPNRDFSRVVHEVRSRGLVVIDRCNLTILEEPGHEDLADFLASQGVQISAALPCYSGENVDRQRGRGV